MKKAFIILISLTFFCSCTDIEQSISTQTGMVKLNIDTEVDLSLYTKTKATQASDDFYVFIKNKNGDIINEGTYADFKAVPVFNMSVDNYVISSEDITEEQAQSARDGKGESRYAANKQFTVTPGSITQISLLCTMANSRFSVGCNEDFNLHFKAATVKVYEQSDASRFFEFDKDNDDTNEANWLYFNIDSDPEVRVDVSATRHNGSISTYSKVIKIEAKGWYKLSLAPKPVSGTVSVDIMVDNLISDEEVEFEVNPYENLELNLPEQQAGNVWATSLYVTPLTADDIISNENKEEIAAATVYEISKGGNQWREVSKVDGIYKISNLTPETNYMLRGRYYTNYTKVWYFTTESAPQLVNNSFEEWSEDDIAGLYGSGGQIKMVYPNSNKADGIWSSINNKTTNGASGANATNNLATLWRWCSATQSTSDFSDGTTAAEISTLGFYTDKIGLSVWRFDEIYSWNLNARKVEFGTLFTGRYNLVSNSFDLGVSHLSRPTSVSFDYKYSPYPENGDKCIAYAIIYDENKNQIATTGEFNSGLQENYTTQTLDFNYSKTNIKCAYITIFFQSGSNGEYSSATRSIKGGYNASPFSNSKIVGSVMKVDNIILNY